MPNEKKRHPTTNFNNILLAITNNNNILEWQGPFEHNDCIGELVTKIKQMLCIKQT